MWILLAFMSALFAGLTSILAKVGLKNTDSTLATALRTIVVVIFAWALVFLTGTIWTIGDISLNSMIFLVLSGLATGASWICYFRALQLGDVNKVVPIDKSSTILTMLFAMALLGETENILIKILGMILIGGGTFLMVLSDKKSPDKETAPLGKSWLIYALFSAVFAALTSILGKVGIENVDSNLGTAIRTIVVLIMAWVMVIIQNKQSQIKGLDKKSWVFIVLSGLATGLSWLCYYKALQDGQASIVVPIDKLSILVTAFFAAFVLKEKTTRKTWIGLALLTAGTFVLLIKF